MGRGEQSQMRRKGYPFPCQLWPPVTIAKHVAEDRWRKCHLTWNNKAGDVVYCGFISFPLVEKWICFFNRGFTRIVFFYWNDYTDLQHLGKSLAAQTWEKSHLQRIISSWLSLPELFLHSQRWWQQKCAFYLSKKSCQHYGDWIVHWLKLSVLFLAEAEWTIEGWERYRYSAWRHLSRDLTDRLFIGIKLPQIIFLKGQPTTFQRFLGI